MSKISFYLENNVGVGPCIICGKDPKKGGAWIVEDGIISICTECVQKTNADSPPGCAGLQEIAGILADALVDAGLGDDEIGEWLRRFTYEFWRACALGLGIPTDEHRDFIESWMGELPIYDPAYKPERGALVDADPELLAVAEADEQWFRDHPGKMIYFRPITSIETKFYGLKHGGPDDDILPGLSRETWIEVKWDGRGEYSRIPHSVFIRESPTRT